MAFSSEFIVDVSGLKKSFQERTIIDGISIQIKSGEIFGFLGPNGSGKTTTIRILCGLMKPDSGKGHCLGYDIIRQTDKIKSKIGYVPQYFCLYPHLTAYENLSLMAALYGVPRPKQRIAEVIDQIGLSKVKKQLSGSFSGGWKQKLSIAVALLHDPFFLFLDEPTASIDPRARGELWTLLHDLAAAGTTIMLSSHNMDEVQHCSNIAYLYQGKIAVAGTIHEIVKNAKLSTWSVKGKNLPLLFKQLENATGVDQVISFYNSLRVSGSNPMLLKMAISRYQSHTHYEWTEVETTLDDVFVWAANRWSGSA
jgi:ABC-2 type transport system ATP-binding protein